MNDEQSLRNKSEDDMSISARSVFAIVVLVVGADAIAQTTTVQTQSRPAERAHVPAAGWSARNKILGRPVYNERGERIGRIDDLIVAPDSSVCFAIVETGGFVGLRRHQIALPVGMLLYAAGGFYLSGASREELLKWPAFAYGEPVPPPPPESGILVRE